MFAELNNTLPEFTFALDENVKLEQEIISWMEG